MAKSQVAVIQCKPETILADIERVSELGGLGRALSAGSPTIIKDNISWHYPFPGANTTPWQLEGTIQALRSRGLSDVVCVQNKTVVTNAFKGEDLNHYVPLFKKYDVPVLYNFKETDMAWVPYRPKARMHVLDKIFPEGIQIPDYFLGKNIVHLPTMKCHIYTTTTGAMKNAFGGLLATKRHYTHSWIHRTLVLRLWAVSGRHTVGWRWFRQVAVGVRGAGGGLSAGPLIKPIKTKKPLTLTSTCSKLPKQQLGESPGSPGTGLVKPLKG
jgi:uncharacterized protein (DUF362 family)